MIAAFTNHLWQSTLFAVLIALLVILFRRNRAQVRYWLWFAASLKFIIPFSLLVYLGTQIHLQKAHPVPPVMAGVSVTLVEITEPFSPLLLAPPPRPATNWLSVTIFGIWIIGFIALSAFRFRNWLIIRAAVRSSTPSNIPAPVEIRSSPGLLEPGVVGWLRPILLLPVGIENKLTPSQLKAVLAHELAHIRRRDNLFASIHMLVEAVFWFHPAVWWIGSKLVEEREKACDEAVLDSGSEPGEYVEAILNVCKFYIESPLACVSGVTGTNLKKRIEAIMANGVLQQLTFAKKAALTLAAAIVISGPLLFGLLNAPIIWAQPTPRVTPKLEAVSIRPCTASPSFPGGRGGGGRAGGDRFSPGRMTLDCVTVHGMIQAAYSVFADGRSRDLGAPKPIEGGPAWIKSDRFTIAAKAEDDANPEMMEGPLLQQLLEDRFKLKLRRESRESPVYEMTAAKGGLKLPRFKEGSCTLLPADHSDPNPLELPARLPPLPAGQTYCPWMAGPSGANFEIEAQGMMMEEFSKIFLQRMDRPVIDKTGETGKFVFHLEFAPEAGARRPGGEAPPPGEPTAPSIFTALQEQLGLRLVPAKGSRDFLVVDSVERPSEN